MDPTQRRLRTIDSTKSARRAKMTEMREWAIGGGLSVIVAGAAMGQDWVESGDALKFPGGSAQQVIGSGPLHRISGLTNTGTDDFVDAYVIELIDAENFYATTSSAWDPDASAAWDTRLFLFTPTGEPLLANDDAPGSVGTQSFVSDPRIFPGDVDPTALPLVNGAIVLVITGYAKDPEDADVFALGSDFGGLFGPDPAAGPFDHWENLHGLVQSGEYTIALQGAAYVSACPADFDGDGDVDTADLLHLLGAWGTPDGDVDGDGDTDTADLLALLAAWGPCE
jgi:hypothetical protein